jgi:hypothetical protein
MEIDLTQIIIALIIVFGPLLVRELRGFYMAWKEEQPDLAYRLENAAEFGVKAAETLKEAGIWSDEKGKQAEAHAVNVAESYLLEQGIRVDVGLILSAVRAAWQDSGFKDEIPAG